jgi:hypothetical protein
LTLDLLKNAIDDTVSGSHRPRFLHLTMPQVADVLRFCEGGQADFGRELNWQQLSAKAAATASLTH